MGVRVNDPKTWKTLWETALFDSDGIKRMADSPEKIERWNKRAQEFSENSGNEWRKERKNQLIDWLKTNGALKDGFKVLDIGAGTGRYAIEMAKMGCDVLAIEPAEEMVKRMENILKEENISNVKIINKSWQSINLKEENIEKNFDLVFASMTPGIQGPNDIDKMISASKYACYLSSHTKDRWHHVEKIAEEVLMKPFPSLPSDFIYRFGYVYSLGYMPVTFYQTKNKKNTNRVYGSIEKIREDIFWSIKNFINIEELSKKNLVDIEKYISAIDLEEEVEKNRKMTSQSMLWFV